MVEDGHFGSKLQGRAGKVSEIEDDLCLEWVQVEVTDQIEEMRFLPHSDGLFAFVERISDAVVPAVVSSLGSQGRRILRRVEDFTLPWKGRPGASLHTFPPSEYPKQHPRDKTYSSI